MTNQKKTKKLVVLAMLSALGFIFMLFGFPVLPAYSFLKLDFSEIPALIGAVLYGPIGGITVELLKNILDYIRQGEFTGVPIGHLANFVAGILLIIPVSLMFRKTMELKDVIKGFVVGIVTMTLFMMLFNYYVLIPAYAQFLSPDGVLSAADKMKIVINGILPFNLIKSIFVAVVFVSMFKKLKFWLMREKENIQN